MIAQMLLKPNASYLSARDRGEVENYLATVKARRAALDEVRRVASPAVDRLIARMRVAYPQFAKFHASGYEKMQRDLGMLTSMAANAMFLGEHDSLDDMFTEWFRTIMKSVHISPQILKDTYETWQDELRNALSEEAWVLMRPELEHITRFLINVPVPARDETGERKPIPPSAPGAKSWKS